MEKFMEKLKAVSIYLGWLAGTVLFGLIAKAGITAKGIDPFLYGIYAPAYFCFCFCPMIFITGYRILTENPFRLLWSVIRLPYTIGEIMFFIAGKLIDWDTATTFDFGGKKEPVEAEEPVETEEVEDEEPCYELDAVEAGLDEDGDIPYENVRTYEDVLLELEAEDVAEDEPELIYDDETKPAEKLVGKIVAAKGK